MRRSLRGKSMRQVIAVGTALVIVIVTGIAGLIWRYQVARTSLTAADRAYSDAGRIATLNLTLWREDQVAPASVGTPSASLLAGLATLTKHFSTTAATAASATPEVPAARAWLARARSAHAAFIATFYRDRPAMGTTVAREVPVYNDINAGVQILVDEIEAVLREGDPRSALPNGAQAAEAPPGLPAAGAGPGRGRLPAQAPVDRG